MVRKLKCECSERFEADIDSWKLFQEIKEFFEGQVVLGIYKEVPVLKPICLFGDDKKVVTQWYPNKWYKCKVCGQLWALEYPEFPALGRVYKLDADGNWGGKEH